MRIDKDDIHLAFSFLLQMLLGVIALTISSLIWGACGMAAVEFFMWLDCPICVTIIGLFSYVLIAMWLIMLVIYFGFIKKRI